MPEITNSEIALDCATTQRMGPNVQFVLTPVSSPAGHGRLSQIVSEARRQRELGDWAAAKMILHVGIALLPSDAEDVELFLEELVRCGEYEAAVEVLESQIADGTSERFQSAWGRIVDEAFRRGTSGRVLLPKSLRPTFQRFQKAFRFLASGDDESALELVRPIGRNSPFAEWKLVLRGLSAYYRQDDARALENWSRLQPDRMPARMVAPYRLRIDPAFAQALSPAGRHKLTELGKRLEAQPVLTVLRQMQERFARCKNGLTSLWPLLRKFVPQLRQEHPDWFDRLQRIMFWEVIERGKTTDVASFHSIFGPLPDDPSCDRLVSLLRETRHLWGLANQSWHDYVSTVAQIPGLTPAERQRLKAMVLVRMGKNTWNLFRALMPDLLGANLPLQTALDSLRRNGQSSPDVFFRQAIEADPHWIEPRRQLVWHLIAMHRYREAISELKKLLQLTPDDLLTLRYAAICCEATHEFDQALQYWNRLIDLDPLDRELPKKRCQSYWRWAWHSLTNTNSAGAIAALEAAAQLQVPGYEALQQATRFFVDLCRGQKAHQILVSLPDVKADDRVLVLGWLVTWSDFFKLPPKLRRMFRTPWKELLDQPSPCPRDIMALAELWYVFVNLRIHTQVSPRYGPAARKFLQRGAGSVSDAMQQLRLGTLLLIVGWDQKFEELVQSWREQAPASPVPPMLLLQYYRPRAVRRSTGAKVQSLIDEFQHNWKHLPSGPLRDELQGRWERLFGRPDTVSELLEKIWN